MLQLHGITAYLFWPRLHGRDGRIDLGGELVLSPRGTRRINDTGQMELNVIKVAIGILPGVQFKQSYLSECGIRGDRSACGHILANKFDAIQVIEGTYDLLARGGIILRIPIFLRSPGKLHDLLRVSVGPDIQAAGQVIWSEFWIAREQVAQVIEQSVSLSLDRSLRNFGIVAPFAEVRGGHDGCRL